jgi:type IV pilus assembly protein PilE
MNRGFTLLELMIALAIVGILSAIALPGYSAVLMRAQRNEAKLALLEVVHAEERHYQLHLAYTDDFEPSLQAGGLGLDARSDTGNYLLSVTLRADGQGYIAIARPDPAHRQAGDRDCARITLDSSGRRGAADSAGNETTGRCWP